MSDDAIQMPRNIEAEAALIGALLIDNRVIDDLPVPLAPEHFYEPLHGRIFERAAALFNGGQQANPVTIKPYFETDEALKSVGGLGYLAKLTSSGAGLIGARDFARQIFDLAVLREIVAVGQRLIESALDTSEAIAPAMLVEEAESMLQRINGSEIDSKNAFSANDCVAKVMEEWDQPTSGVASGCMAELDRAIGKIRPTELVIVAGRPGSGKTAFAVSYSNGVARRSDTDDGGGVLFVSHEMGAQEIGGRLIADTAAYSMPINYSAIEGNKLGMDERERVRRIHGELSTLPLQIIQVPTLTVSRLRGLVRRWKRIFEKRGVPLRLLVVDYLQLMSGSRRGKDENRTAEISEISRGLKQIAMEEEIGVMALSQLSRALEQREDKRPRLSDLRESGSIEQDANKVIGLYRAAYYHEQIKPHRGTKGFSEAALMNWEADYEAIRNEIEFLILKRRNGRSGFSVKGRFDGEHQAVRGA